MKESLVVVVLFIAGRVLSNRGKEASFSIEDIVPWTRWGKVGGLLSFAADAVFGAGVADLGLEVFGAEVGGAGAVAVAGGIG